MHSACLLNRKSTKPGQKMSAIQRFLRDDGGPTAVEYAVIVALILMTCLGTIKLVGSTTSGIWATNQTRLEEAGF